MTQRYDRNIRFFGKEGQKIISESNIAIVGIGGIGAHVLQQLAYIGVKELALIDKEKLDVTNLNRYVIAQPDDLINCPVKVDIGEREALKINPKIKIKKINKSAISYEAFEAIKDADHVFGCVDREGIRFILNELCSAYNKPYFDLASDIIPGNPLLYGGRFFCSWDETACLFCRDVLDMNEVQNDLGGPEFQEQQNAIYGIEKEFLGQPGPSVVSINGLISSLAVTEFIVGVTGIRKPVTLATYRGNEAKVIINKDMPIQNCYYCHQIKGMKHKADVERYVRDGIGEWL